MAKKEIIVNISKDGEIRIEAKGFKGRECLQATKPFEEALGQVSERKMKTQLDAQKERQTLDN